MCQCGYRSDYYRLKFVLFIILVSKIPRESLRLLFYPRLLTFHYYTYCLIMVFTLLTPYSILTASRKPSPSPFVVMKDKMLMATKFQSEIRFCTDLIRCFLALALSVPLSDNIVFSVFEPLNAGLSCRSSIYRVCEHTKSRTILSATCFPRYYESKRN